MAVVGAAGAAGGDAQSLRFSSPSNWMVVVLHCTRGQERTLPSNQGSPPPPHGCQRIMSQQQTLSF